MALQSDPAKRALWVNPDLKAGAGGVFALIIGVSRYPHLNGGVGPLATNAFGLGQLSVSALTAYRFFDWLRSGYALAGLPIAQARLLLSPLRQGDPDVLADELAGCDPNVVSHALDADFNGCSRAIREWYAGMEAVTAATSSRSLFMFSGHGLEIMRGHQVLLPSDYLQPPAAINDAVSTRNLIDCLPFLRNISSHVLMIDACRNDLDELRSRNVQGSQILNMDSPGATNPNYDQSVLYATTSGLKAYSPRKGTLSLFGQALLDGLTNKPDPQLGEPPIELRRQGKLHRIEIDRLTSYMKGRVDALINATNSKVVQSVRADKSSNGNPVDLAEIAVTAPPSAAGPLVEEIALEGLAPPPNGSIMDESAAATAEGSKHGKPKLTRVKRPPRDAWFRGRYPILAKPAKAPPAEAAASDKAAYLHDLFGSEAITYPWLDNLRLVRLADGATSGPESVMIVSVAHAMRSDSLHRIQVRFRLNEPHPAGHLLHIKDMSGRGSACALPGDQQPTDYQLEIDSGEGTQGISFLRFAAFLPPEQRGPLGAAAKAWDKMRALSASAAAESMAGRGGFAAEVETMLRDKVESPLAATVGAILLLKGDRLDLMHDWTVNLANWFPTLSDGVVLATEQFRRQGKLDPGWIEWFVDELSPRSLPFTADCFVLAVDLLRDIGRGRLEGERATVAKAKALAARFDAVMPYFRDGGLFCSYAAWPDTFPVAERIAAPERTAAKARTPRAKKGRKT